MKMLLRRIITVLFALPIIFGAILYPEPWAFQVLVLLVVGAGMVEGVGLIVPGATRADKSFGIFLGMGLAAWFFFGPGFSHSFLPILTLFLFIIFFFYMVQKTAVPNAIAKIGGLFFVVVYVSVLFSHFGFLRARPDGTFWVLLALGAVWCNDTFAYFTGKAFGRHRLAAHLSPGKTIEGFWGGLAGTACGVYLFKGLMVNPLDTRHTLILILLIGIVAPFGDLAESLLKRSANVKDSGFIIPGHGGILDRLDALLFVGPLVYYFAQTMYH